MKKSKPKKLPRRITRDFLNTLDLCIPGLKLFCRLFPKGAPWSLRTLDVFAAHRRTIEACSDLAYLMEEIPRKTGLMTGWAQKGWSAVFGKADKLKVVRATWERWLKAAKRRGLIPAK